MANIQVNFSPRQTPLPNDGSWHRDAIINANQGNALKPLNVFEAGTSYVTVIALSSAPARNNPDWTNYYVHGINHGPDRTGKKFYIPGFDEECSQEEAVFAQTFEVREAIKADKHRGEVLPLLTTEDGQGRKRSVFQVVTGKGPKTENSVHPLVAGKSAPVIEHFQAAVNKYIQDKENVNSIDDIGEAVLEVFAENAQAQA